MTYVFYRFIWVVVAYQGVTILMPELSQLYAKRRLAVVYRFVSGRRLVSWCSTASYES